MTITLWCVLGTLVLMTVFLIVMLQ